jgi:hypothetical protein
MAFNFFIRWQTLNRTRAILVGAILVCASVLALGIHNRVSYAPYTSSAQGPTTPVDDPPTSADRLEAEIVTIRRSGFEPLQITRPAGRFLLVVDNRSELEEVDLRLDRRAGERQHQVRVRREALDWSEMFDLPPGHYVLTEATHPEWTCDITITPR